MEANRKEECAFDVKFKGENWNINACWLNTATDNVCWYEGTTQRDGVNFYRTFSPSEINMPQIKRAA